MKYKTKFCDVIGYSPESKILELLLEGRGYEYTMTDIVNGVAINKKRGYEILHDYIKKKILIKTKKVKHFQFYQLNKTNPRVKMLLRFFDEVILK